MRRTGTDDKASPSLVDKATHVRNISSTSVPSLPITTPASLQRLFCAPLVSSLRRLKMRLPPFTVYLVNIADGLQILLCFVLEMYLLPSALPLRGTDHVTKDIRSISAGVQTPATGTLFGMADGEHFFSEEEASRVGRYVIIILLGWIFKPLLACLTDVVPLISLGKLSAHVSKPAASQRRLPWLYISNILTAMAAFFTSWALKYHENISLIVFLLMLCGIGLALSTSVSEAIILEKNRCNSTSEAALGLSLIMSVKVSAVTATLGYVVFMPLNWINPSLILLSFGIYCSLLAICFVFVDDSDLIVPFDPEMAMTKRIFIEEEIDGFSSQSVVLRMKVHLSAWKEYLRRNSMLAPLLVLVILFAAPDLRIVLSMLKVQSEKWVSHLNTLLPIIIQLAKLTGVGLFQFGLYRFPYQQVATAATCVCFTIKLCGVILLICFRMGLDIFSSLGLNIFSVLVLDAFVAGVAAELVLLTLLLLFCRHCPPGFEATAISIFLIASQSGSFLSKLDSVWITSYIASPTSFHFLSLQALSSFFYLLSLLLLGMLTNPSVFKPMKDSFSLSYDPLETSSLLQCEQGITTASGLYASPTSSSSLLPSSLPTTAEEAASSLFTTSYANTQYSCFPSVIVSPPQEAFLLQSEGKRGDKKTQKKKRSRKTAKESEQNFSDAATVNNAHQWIFIDKDRNEFSCQKSVNACHYEIDQIDWASVML